MVGKYDFLSVEEFYKSQNRYIKEQILNLDESEKILLYNYLEQNIIIIRGKTYLQKNY